MNSQLKEFQRLGEPMASAARGNSITNEALANAASERQTHYMANRLQIGAVMNSTTIATELKRQVILAEILTDFTRRLAPLGLFSAVFNNVPLEGTDKIQVPFYDLDATAPTAWNSATGYSPGNTTTSFREISVTNRVSQGMAITSQDLARQPFLNVVELGRLKAEKLAYDVFTDVLSVVTAANYSTAVLSTTPEGFSSDNIADLKLACKTWPDSSRILMLDSEYDASLLKDPSFKNALNAASDSAIKEGRLFPRVFGFNYTECPNIPSNSESLKGFVAQKSAILFASSPIKPHADVLRAGTAYDFAVDPKTGIVLEYRAFGNNQLDRAEHYIEANYGYSKGNANALKRIVSP